MKKISALLVIGFMCCGAGTVSADTDAYVDETSEFVENESNVSPEQYYNQKALINSIQVMGGGVVQGNVIMVQRYRP